jgi:hypothetical protein
MNEQKRTNAQGGCDRGEDLVAYLYGEADRHASQDFQTHLGACASCREELAALGGVRASVALWRESLLGASEAPSLAENFAPPAPQAFAAPFPAPRERSALAALREFFALSPLWLKGATAAFALAFCALAVVALRAGGDERTVTQVVTKTIEVPAPPSEEQVNELVERRVETRLAELAKRSGPPREAVVQASAPARNRPRAEVAQTGAARRKPAAPPAARRNELFREDSEGLPRLSDLLSGSY